MKTDYQNNIILRLRKIREENKYSQKEIAQLLGISNGQMGNIESPKYPNKYTLSQIYRISNNFNIPIDHIFLEDEDYSSNKDIINLLISNIIKYEER